MKIKYSHINDLKPGDVIPGRGENLEILKIERATLNGTVFVKITTSEGAYGCIVDPEVPIICLEETLVKFKDLDVGDEFTHINFSLINIKVSKTQYFNLDVRVLHDINPEVEVKRKQKEVSRGIQKKFEFMKYILGDK